MTEKKATDEQIIAALAKHKGIRTMAAAELKLSERGLLRRLAAMRGAGLEVHATTYQNRNQPPTADFEFTPLPDDDIPIEQLIEQRKRKFTYKREHEEASKLIPIRIKIGGPIGLLHFGDPHVDDDGCDIEAIERHTALVNATEGLFA